MANNRSKIDGDAHLRRWGKRAAAVTALMVMIITAYKVCSIVTAAAADRQKVNDRLDDIEKAVSNIPALSASIARIEGAMGLAPRTVAAAKRSPAEIKPTSFSGDPE